MGLFSDQKCIGLFTLVAGTQAFDKIASASDWRSGIFAAGTAIGAVLLTKIWDRRLVVHQAEEDVSAAHAANHDLTRAYLFTVAELLRDLDLSAVNDNDLNRSKIKKVEQYFRDVALGKPDELKLLDLVARSEDVVYLQTLRSEDADEIRQRLARRYLRRTCMVIHQVALREGAEWSPEWLKRNGPIHNALKVAWPKLADELPRTLKRADFARASTGFDILIAKMILIEVTDGNKDILAKLEQQAITLSSVLTAIGEIRPSPTPEAISYELSRVLSQELDDRYRYFQTAGQEPFEQSRIRMRNLQQAFFGRQLDLQRFAELFETGGGTWLIDAEWATGKSAFLANARLEMPSDLIVATHFFTIEDTRTQSGEAALKGLLYQLLPYTKLQGKALVPYFEADLRTTLRTVIAELSQAGHRVAILLDALDEAVSPIYFETFCGLPSGTFVFATARKAEALGGPVSVAIENWRGSATAFQLAPMTGPDIRNWIERRDEGQFRNFATEASATVLRLSEGIPLLIQFILEDLLAGVPTPVEIQLRLTEAKQLGSGMAGYVARLYQHLLPYPQFIRFFQILAITKGPIHISEICRYFEIEEYEIDAADPFVTRWWKRLVTPAGDALTLPHQRLADAVRKLPKFGCAAKEAGWAGWIAIQMQLDAKWMDRPYLLTHGLSHLLGVPTSAGIKVILMEMPTYDYVKRKLQEGQTDRLLGEMASLSEWGVKNA